MKRIFVVLISGCLIWLVLSACGDKQEQAEEQSVQSKREAGVEERIKKRPEARKALTGRERGLGMVRDPTRVVPGWECPSMPGIRSAYPGNCPGTSVPMVRKGGWTCRDYPQVSSMDPGKCPFDGTDLVKVADLEKEMGKTIAELTKEVLATQKTTQK